MCTYSKYIFFYIFGCNFPYKVSGYIVKPVGKFDFFYFSGSNNAYLERLEKMSSNDLFTFIDDMPSNIDSEVVDVSDEENEEGGQMSEVNSLFDIENLPIDFEDIIETTNEEAGWES